MRAPGREARQPLVGLVVYCRMGLGTKVSTIQGDWREMMDWILTGMPPVDGARQQGQERAPRDSGMRSTGLDWPGSCCTRIVECRERRLQTEQRVLKGVRFPGMTTSSCRTSAAMGRMLTGGEVENCLHKVFAKKG